MITQIITSPHIGKRIDGTIGKIGTFFHYRPNFPDGSAAEEVDNFPA